MVTKIESSTERIGAVAFLDILGFRGIWKRQPAVDILSKLQSTLSLLEKTLNEDNEHKDHYARFEKTTISDTIIIEFQGEGRDTIIYIAEILLRIFTPFLIHGMPLRGTVAYGSYFRSGSTFVGPAVDDAAEWYEQADWIGVILTPSASLAIKSGYADVNPKTLEKTLYKFWLPYDVPCKNRCGKIQDIPLYALNWPNSMNRIITEIGSLKSKSTYGVLLEILSKQGAISPSVYSKYEHTHKFIKTSLGIK